MDDNVFDSSFRPLDYGGPCGEDAYGNMIDEEEMIRKRLERALNQEFTPTIPGVNTPLEVQMKDGRNFVIPPQQPMTTQPNTYVPGGVTTMQGGLNPLTGMIEPTISYQGFSYDPLMGGHQIPNNGYASYEAYPPYPPQYQQQMAMPSYGPPRVMTADSPNGFMPYYPGCHQSPNSPYYTGPYQQQYPYQDPWQARIQNFYRTQHLYQNSYNNWWREVLYDSDTSGLDIRTVLAQIVPSDETKEKMNRNWATSNGYYNSWEASRLAQQEYEKKLNEQKEIMIRLSRITHTYLKDGFDEEYLRKILYPEPPQPKVFNPVTATKEEKEEYDKILKEQEHDRVIENIKMQRDAREQTKAMMPYFLQQIKESHDRVLGIQPGQSYDLQYFLDNGYKLNIQIAKQKARQAQRDGTKKYNQNYYRASLSTVNKRPIPVVSKDDECISINDFSSRSCRSSNLQPTKLDGIMKDEYGHLVYTGIPVDASEREAHDHFLEQLGYKKRESDARKAIR